MPKALYTEIRAPQIVERAMELARELGFPLAPEGCPGDYQGPPTACIPQVGRLLQALAAGKPGGLIGEQGAGAGVGTAWLASGLTGGARLVSAELDPKLAAGAARLFAGRPDVEVRAGDWHEALRGEGPFDLLFMDAMPAADLEPENWDRTVELVKVGGQIVMDDLTPVELWPAHWEGLTDRKRELAFANPRVVGAEVRTTAVTSALIVTRLR
ncbi:MAG TPA: class I SAM-dependent methyltransferase [Thermoanaerobaculia bacterium]|nr:class I SAM-dependent methyltransferase [Thermoanaerobaculia bacterium]